ncbi:M16 family metallopeptidase [Sulfurimonas sp.]|uniref:M16 family metallopeptidase n=1 Tax=Sulfurimonas sp. TaxID=2022749 RepID=UPI002B48E2A3|nr:insulinase family protein [Sulfurimonas sp.]
MRAVILILLFLSVVNASNKNNQDRYEDIQYYQLNNGLEVYLLNDEKSENTQIRIKIKVGSVVEDEKTLGLTHLLEHLVFRDERIPHRDYMDYILEEGGTYVNGYTRRYETEYTATIDSKHSYWITKTFAKMLFDKKVTNLDLEVEKGALQTEIGEYQWYKKKISNLLSTLKWIAPPKENIHRDEFGLKSIKPSLPLYLSQQNNKNFSLKRVLQHYDTYYYPANMCLTVVGNFDIQKMKKVIEKEYGQYDKSGTKKAIKPLENPTLNKNNYKRYYEGLDKNAGYIGAKYLQDNYKKYLILSAYTNNVALRIQQHLRNKNGNTYSVQANMFTDRKAGIASIYFDGLGDEFNNNIKYVKEAFLNDVSHLSDSTIDDALRKYETDFYTSIEHDSKSLMSLVNTAQYLRDEQNITDNTAHQIFHSITHDEFRKVVQNTFTTENGYEIIYRDYYFFPFEMFILSLLLMILLAIVYFKMHRIDYYQKGLTYTKREVILNRRLSNRFLGFLKFLFVFLLASLIWEWIKYLLSKFLLGDPYFIYTVNVPYSYIVTVMDGIFSIIIFLIIYRYAFKYYAQLDIDKENMYLIGNNITVVSKDMIEKIDVVKWSISKFIKIIGSAIFFWKPLIEVKLKNGNTFYLRASNAEHLKEDLHKYLNLE